MIDKLTQKIVDSLHKSAKETIIPIKEVLQKNVDMHTDIGGKILKLGTVLLVFFGILKMTDREDKPNYDQDVPRTIIINNYIGEKDGEGKQ